MFQKILIPTDLTNFSDKAFITGRDLAEKHNGKLILIFVLPDYRYPVVAQYFPAAAQEKARKEAEAQLHQFVASHQAEALVEEVLVKTGVAYDEILTAAENKKADTIIISSHDRGPMGRFLMGSNAEKVVRYAHCSVLVIKEHD